MQKINALIKYLYLWRDAWKQDAAFKTNSNTVEPPYNGHFDGGVLNWEVKIYCKYNGRGQCGLSFIQRCPLLGVSVNEGSTLLVVSFQ